MSGFRKRESARPAGKMTPGVPAFRARRFNNCNNCHASWHDVTFTQEILYKKYHFLSLFLDSELMLLILLFEFAPLKGQKPNFRAADGAGGS
jgi:hypothetical protein